MAPRFTLKNDKRTGGCAVRSFPRKGQAVAGRLGPCSEARYRAHHHVAAALKYFDEVGTGTRGKRPNIRGRSRARLSASGTHIRGLLLPRPAPKPAFDAIDLHERVWMCQSATRSCFAHELAGLYLNHQLVVVAKVVAVDVILLSPLHTKVRGRCSGRYYKLPRANKGSAIRCALRLKSPTVWHNTVYSRSNVSRSSCACALSSRPATKTRADRQDSRRSDPPRDVYRLSWQDGGANWKCEPSSSAPRARAISWMSQPAGTLRCG